MILGDLVESGLADLRTGPFGTQLHASDYVVSGRPVLNVRNVGFGEVRDERLEYVNDETAQRLSGHILQEGDIIFGRKGAVERHAYIPERYSGALQGSDCIRLRIGNAAPIRPLFASFALRTHEHKEWMKGFCAHGVTMASLNQDILRQVVLPDLTLHEQDRAISVLKSLDDLIENNRRRVELLEQMAEAIYREWFVHFRYPGHEGVAMVDSPLGPIPEGWEASRVQDLTSLLSRGISPHYNPVGPYVVVNQRCIRQTRLDLSLARRQDRPVPQIKLLKKGDVLVNSTGVGTLGRVTQVLTDPEDLTADSHVSVVRPDPKNIRSTFFGMMMLSKEPEFERLGVGSTGQTELSRASIGGLEVLVPPLPLQSEFDRAVADSRQLVLGLMEENAVLAAIRDLLLPKLVTGQIDVSELDPGPLVEAAG